MFPIVTSTAAKSSVRLVTAFSFSNTLQFECFRKLSEKMSRSDLVNLYLPPGLRNFVLNNYWFLGKCSEPRQPWLDVTPERKSNVTRLCQGRGGKVKRNYKEEATTTDSEDEDDKECFLNIKSRKLTLMRRLRRTSVTLQEESPVCTSQDYHYRRQDSQDVSKLLGGASCGEHSKETTAAGEETGARETDLSEVLKTPPRAKRKFLLKTKSKSSE